MAARPFPLRVLWHAPSRSTYVVGSGPQAEREARQYVATLRAGEASKTPLSDLWSSTPESEWSVAGAFYNAADAALRRLPGIAPLPVSEICP